MFSLCENFVNVQLDHMEYRKNGNCKRKSRVNFIVQFYVVWILRLINVTTELIDYTMLLYLQGIILNILFVQVSIPKLII